MQSVSEQIFEALKSSPEPRQQIEAVLQVSKNIAASIQSFSTGNGGCIFREYEDDTII